jgi:hypothetical protein
MRNIRNIAISLIAIITLTPTSASAEKSEYREPSLNATSNTWSQKTILMTPPRSYWLKVAECQTQVNKMVKKRNSNAKVIKHLSIPETFWIRYGGTSFASHPNRATRSDQIIVANRIAVLGWKTTDSSGATKRIRPKGFKFTKCASDTIKTLKNYNKLVRVSLPDDPNKYCPKWERLFEEQGLPPKLFSYIAWRESRCQTKAIGWNYYKGKSHKDCKLSAYHTYKKCGAVRSYDSGLLQINSSWKTLTSQVCNSKYGDLTVLQDPFCNVKVSRELYENSSGRLSNWSIKTHRH